MVNEKPIRDRVIEIAQAIIEEEFAAIAAEDGLGAAAAAVLDITRPRLRAALDGIGDCRSFERLSDRQIRAAITPELRPLVRKAIAEMRPS